MMDDWPARLEASDPERFREMDRGLRSLIGRSQRLLSISSAMSAAYHERYGGNWPPLPNGSDPARFPPEKAAARGPDAPVVNRYLGDVADDIPSANGCAFWPAVVGLAEPHPGT